MPPPRAASGQQEAVPAQPQRLKRLYHDKVRSEIIQEFPNSLKRPGVRRLILFQRFGNPLNARQCTVEQT